MIFYTTVNEDGKFIVPAFAIEYKNGDEPKWLIVDKPCIFELFYDTIEKVKEYYWDFPSLDWTGIKMQKIKIEFL